MAYGLTLKRTYDIPERFGVSPKLYSGCGNGCIVLSPLTETIVDMWYGDEKTKSSKQNILFKHQDGNPFVGLDDNGDIILRANFGSYRAYLDFEFPTKSTRPETLHSDMVYLKDHDVFLEPLEGHTGPLWVMAGTNIVFGVGDLNQWPHVSHVIPKNALITNNPIIMTRGKKTFPAVTPIKIVSMLSLSNIGGRYFYTPSIDSMHETYRLMVSVPDGVDVNSYDAMLETIHNGFNRFVTYNEENEVVSVGYVPDSEWYTKLRESVLASVKSANAELLDLG